VVLKCGSRLEQRWFILVDRLTIAVGRSAQGIPWPLEKVYTVILFISPVKPHGAEEHSAFLAHIAGCIRDSGNRIAAAGGQQELLDLLSFQNEEQEG
jgi:mannitol/fructose-specific phosphotransferase system IIA component (Ntr-type)